METYKRIGNDFYTSFPLHTAMHNSDNAEMKTWRLFILIKDTYNNNRLAWYELQSSKSEQDTRNMARDYITHAGLEWTDMILVPPDGKVRTNKR